MKYILVNLCRISGSDTSSPSFVISLLLNYFFQFTVMMGREGGRVAKLSVVIKTAIFFLVKLVNPSKSFIFC